MAFAAYWPFLGRVVAEENRVVVAEEKRGVVVLVADPPPFPLSMRRLLSRKKKTLDVRTAINSLQYLPNLSF